MAFDESAKLLLEALPAAVTVLNPVVEPSESLRDLEVEWLNTAMSELVGNRVVPGLSLQQVYPTRNFGNWLTGLIQLRATKAIDRQFWDLTDSPVGGVFQVDICWWDEVLLLIATNMAPKELTMSDALGAANTLSRVKSSLPMAYSARPGEKWLTFPTDSFLSAIGQERESFRKAQLHDLMDTEDFTKLTAWAAIPELERPQNFRFQTSGKEGQRRWLELWAMKLSIENQAPLHGIADNFIILTDVDGKTRAEDEKRLIHGALDQQLAGFTSALNASSDGFAIWQRGEEPDGTRAFRLVFMNKAGARRTTKPAEALVGLRLEQIAGEDQAGDLRRVLTQAIDSGEIQFETIDLATADGWSGSFENTVFPIDGDRVLSTFRDVSEARLEHDRLIWLADHDHLTGLPNRRNLEQQMAASLTRAQKTSTPAGFVFIDIDDFKAVNDSRGHDAGDVLLQAFVTRLQSAVRDQGIVARLAGDEFAVVLDSVASSAELESILDHVMCEVRKPFDVSAEAITVTCSAGAVLCGGDEAITDILRTTDKAMYRAKHSGKNQFRIANTITS
jgi:diguanylate cyclase (GGDEF)-like protein